jgi:hypothetical protein
MIFTIELNTFGELELRANGVCLPGLTSVEICSHASGITTINATIIVQPTMKNRFIFRDKDGTST